MTIQIKRAYDPVNKSDGYRVLVDGLWPRGVSKASAKIDLWAKDAAPSKELRSWFHEDKEKRFKEFAKKYKAELAKSEGLTDLKKALRGKGAVTLVTGVKDIEHSHIPILLKQLR